MPSIDLTDPANGTRTDATIIGANNAILEALLNGGLDNNNIALAAAIEIAKLKGFPNDALKFLRGDGTWAATASVISSELDYAEITADKTISNTVTTEAAAVVVITGTSFTFSGGSPVLVEFFAPAWTNQGDSGIIRFVLFDGATPLGWIATAGEGSVGFDSTAVRGSYRYTPSAGPHQYIIKAFTGNTGTPAIVRAGSGGTGKFVPAYLRVVRT